MRFILVVKIYAFAYGFDTSYLLQRVLQMMFNRCFQPTCLTYSKGFFNFRSKFAITTEKRLMIYIKATREAFDKLESSVGWIRPHSNIVDRLMKLTKCDVLEHLVNIENIELTAA